MSKVSLEPYVFFRGNAKEAMNFYKRIFGGKLSIMKADEYTGGDMPNKDWMKGKLMHASLRGGLISLMASDSPIASKAAKKVELSISGTDENKLRKVFSSLSRGGKIKMPLKKEFWGDTFGALTDKFGVDWMINIGSAMSS